MTGYISYYSHTWIMLLSVLYAHTLLWSIIVQVLVYPMEISDFVLRVMVQSVINSSP